MFDDARESLEKAQRRISKSANRSRRDVEYAVGEKVLLKLTPQIWKTIISKSVHPELIPKYDGPFEIVQKVRRMAYRLKLPNRLKVHPTFHVSYLKKFFEDELDMLRAQKLRAPPVIRKQYVRGVKKVLDHRTLGQSKKNVRTDYLVQWTGETETDATWEKAVDLWQFEKEIAAY